MKIQQLELGKRTYIPTSESSVAGMYKIVHKKENFLSASLRLCARIILASRGGAETLSFGLWLGRAVSFVLDLGLFLPLRRIGQKIMIGIFVFLYFQAPLFAASTGQAEKEYQKGKYSEATAQYKTLVQKHPTKPELQFNFGSSSYKCEKFEDAAEAFYKSLKTDQPTLQQQAYYNLGNTQYRIGQKTEKENPQQTIQVWEQALQSYQNSLQLKKDDADAKFNYEFVKKKLEQLKKENPEDKQDPKDKDKNQDKDKDKNKDQDKKDDSSQPENKNPPQDPKKDDSDKKQDKNKDSSENQQKPPQGNEENQNKPEEKNQPQQNPGEMSQEEAKNLLDSLKGDEKKMPVEPIGVENQKRMENNPKRDW